MSDAPDFIWTRSAVDMQDDPLPYGEWHIEQSPRWREYIRRDPAVLAALPEVQALVAAAVMDAADETGHPRHDPRGAPMNKLDAMRGLYDAVKDGRPLTDLPRPIEMHTDLVWKATQGSVDAAFALIAATLPGWNRALQNDAANVWKWRDGATSVWDVAVFSAEVKGQPATSLLLATLAALIAIEEGKG
jgi:hypothetical protein